MIFEVVPHLFQCVFIDYRLSMVDTCNLQGGHKTFGNRIKHTVQSAYASLQVPGVRPAKVTPAANDEVLASPPLEVDKVTVRDDVIAAGTPAEFDFPDVAGIVGSNLNLRWIEWPQGFEVFSSISMTVRYPVKFRINEAVAVFKAEPCTGPQEIARRLQGIWLRSKKSCDLIILALYCLVTKDYGNNRHLTDFPRHTVNAVIHVVTGVDIGASVRSNSRAVIEEADQHLLLSLSAEDFP